MTSTLKDLFTQSMDVRQNSSSYGWKRWWYKNIFIQRDLDEEVRSDLEGISLLLEAMTSIPALISIYFRFNAISEREKLDYGMREVIKNSLSVLLDLITTLTILEQLRKEINTFTNAGYGGSQCVTQLKTVLATAQENRNQKVYLEMKKTLKALIPDAYLLFLDLEVVNRRIQSLSAEYSQKRSHLSSLDGTIERAESNLRDKESVLREEERILDAKESGYRYAKSEADRLHTEQRIEHERNTGQTEAWNRAIKDPENSNLGGLIVMSISNRISVTTPPELKSVIDDYDRASTRRYNASSDVRAAEHRLSSANSAIQTARSEVASASQKLNAARSQADTKNRDLEDSGINVTRALIKPWMRTFYQSRHQFNTNNFQNMTQAYQQCYQSQDQGREAVMVFV